MNIIIGKLLHFLLREKKRAKGILGNRLDELYHQFEKEKPEDKEALLFETESYYNNKTNLAVDLRELLLGLEEEYLKKE